MRDGDRSRKSGNIYRLRIDQLYPSKVKEERVPALFAEAKRLQVPPRWANLARHCFKMKK